MVTIGKGRRRRPFEVGVRVRVRVRVRVITKRTMCDVERTFGDDR